MDNIFIERLWRSIKYEEVHLKAYADGLEARADIGNWMTFYNFRRPHQAMNNQMPMAVWRAGMDKIEAAANAVDMPRSEREFDGERLGSVRFVPLVGAEAWVEDGRRSSPVPSAGRFATQDAGRPHRRSRRTPPRL